MNCFLAKSKRAILYYVKHLEKVSSVFGRYLMSMNTPLLKKSKDIMPTHSKWEENYF
jgi:hypothetical protein